MFSVFFSVAIEHQPAEMLEFINDVVTSTDERFSEFAGKPFYAPRMWPQPSDYPSPIAAFGIVEDAIRNSHLVVVYYPERVVSGALIEIGMAAMLKKPTLIFTNDVENLSYFVRAGSDSIKVTMDPLEILPWITKNLAELGDLDLDNICGSCTAKGTEPHTCPYSEDVRGDHESLCNCCEACTTNCARDI